MVIQWEKSAALPLRCWGGKCRRGGHCLSTWVIHPTPIIFSGAHPYLTLGARPFKEIGYSCDKHENFDTHLPEGLQPCCKVGRW